MNNDLKPVQNQKIPKTSARNAPKHDEGSNWVSILRKASGGNVTQDLTTPTGQPNQGQSTLNAEQFSLRPHTIPEKELESRSSNIDTMTYAQDVTSKKNSFKQQTQPQYSDSYVASPLKIQSSANTLKMEQFAPHDVNHQGPRNQRSRSNIGVSRPVQQMSLTG